MVSRVSELEPDPRRLVALVSESIRVRLRPGQRALLAARAAAAGYPDASAWLRALAGLPDEPAPVGRPRSEEAAARDAHLRALADGGMSAVEVAAASGLSVGWVRRVLRRGR